MLRHVTRVGVALSALVLLAAGCSDDPRPADPGTPPATTAAAEPQTVEAAQAAAERELAAYAAGDWAGAWDLWTAEGKAAISRDDYIRLHTECGTLTGAMFEITGARLENPTTAVITWERVIVTGAATMIYEDGAWRFQPDEDAMADYAKGVDQALADRRAEGACQQ